MLALAVMVNEMLLCVLFALLSLAAAQCGNSCNCGVTTCCQTSYSSGSPYSIFNLGYNQQDSYTQQLGSSQQYGSSVSPDSASKTCLKVNPIQYPLAKLNQGQPVFTRVIQNSDENRLIDSICLTLFPQPDDSTTFVQYDSFVYCDGSHSVTTTVSDQVGVGTSLRGNAYFSFYQRFFASLGNNIYVGCNQNAYGDSGLPSVFASTLGSVSPLGTSCLQQIENIIQCVGQGPANGLYVLPYRLPTRCVTQQVCSLFNPLLYSNNNNQYI